MAPTQQQKAFCVVEYAKTMSVIIVQRNFLRQFGVDLPDKNSIKHWHRQLMETSCLCKGKATGRPLHSEETVDRVRQSFQHNPTKSVQKANHDLALLHSTVWDVLCKRLKFKAYKLQLVQALTEDDKKFHTLFSVDMLGFLENDFRDRIVFSNEATFHLNGKVNRHNVWIWGSEQPWQIIEHVRDSPKLNVFTAICRMKLYGPFFFSERTVTGHLYLDMLQMWLIPQFEEDSRDFIFQQDGAPSHFHNDVRGYLNEHLPQRWIGRTGPADEALLRSTPRSPDMTPCDFFLWGFVKDHVFVPLLPQDLLELWEQITEVFAAVIRDMLIRVWEEMDYQLDICHVMKGIHIESL